MLSERAGKTAGLALLATLAVVAAIVWQWPRPTPPPESTARQDVILPTVATGGETTMALVDAPRPPLATLPVAATAGPIRHVSHSTAPVVAPDAVPGDGPIEIVAEGREVTPIASRSINIAMRPALPDAAAAQSRGAAHSLVHSAVAFGNAFRRAGVSTGAAFTRIF